MSAIIHNSFRKYNADNFITSIGTNKVYLMIGKITPWSGISVGEYIEETPSDTAIPIPLDTTIAPSIHHADMIAAKLVPLSSVSHVIKRVNWTTGTEYVEYDHLLDDIIDEDFFVFTTAFRVYKCISNYGGALSTVEPTGVSTDIIETADHYRWKFMFEVPQGEVLKFVTSDWIPVKTLLIDDQTDQWDVQDGAVHGSLVHIDVTDGGTGYKSNVGTALTGTANTITLDSTETTEDYYVGLTVFIREGTGANQIRTITAYDGAQKIATVDSDWTSGQVPNNTSDYSVTPAVSVATTGGTGTGATARVSSVDADNGGVIKKIAMISVGSGYSKATATVDAGGGTGAIITPKISPQGGHGSNPVAELGGAFVMLNARLIGYEGADFPVGPSGQFRKVHLLSNPEAGGSLATATTYNALEMDDGTGQMIYTEFRTPINRASDSTEDIKLVVEF
ncbi:uncharacterized protein METZ01_LOCUS100971 [marine metagenome]|uniref:Bacteriophage T4 Gp8 domain-containing protein n=1 Tax=marine metagenome TaxID=408172 RepID=A0A381W836_9ZZZZ